MITSETQLNQPHPIPNLALGHGRKEVPDLYLRAIVDAYPSGAAVLDETGTVLYLNRTWCTFGDDFGYAGAQSAACHSYLELSERISGGSATEFAAIVEGLNQILFGKRAEFQKEYCCPNSHRQHWVMVHATRFDLPNGFRVLVTQQDITSSRQFIEARGTAEERLRLLLDVTHILPWEAKFPTSRFTYVGEQAVHLLGYPIQDWYEGDFWFTHLHPEDRQRTMTECVKLANAHDNYELDYRMIASDRRVVWLHSLVTVIRENGQPRTIRGFSIDVTESRQTETALRELSARLIHAQEEERSRVARELHDDLNQRMALLTMELGQLADIKRSSELGARLRSVREQAREISSDIHRLSYKLHPSKLDYLGLAPAIKSLCQEIRAMGKFEVEFQQSELPDDLPKDVTLCVFRIAQEALRNCARHSGASWAQVTLAINYQEIYLSVSDDGCGFDMESDAMKKGLGFTSMRERLRIVGGKIEVRSKPMQGTVIKVSVPVIPELETANA